MANTTSANEQSATRVLVVTPVGPDGMGGIDRLYSYMREHLKATGDNRIDYRYFAARGNGGAEDGTIAG